MAEGRLEYVVAARNEANAVMREMGVNIHDLTRQAQRFNAQARQAGDSAERAFSAAGNSAQRAQGPLARLLSLVGRLGGGIRGMAGHARGAFGYLGGAAKVAVAGLAVAMLVLAYRSGALGGALTRIRAAAGGAGASFLGLASSLRTAAVASGTFLRANWLPMLRLVAMLRGGGLFAGVLALPVQIMRGLGGALRTVAGLFTSLLGAVFRLAAGLVGALLNAVTRVASAIGGVLYGALQRVFGFIATGAKVAVVGLAAAMGLLARQGIAVNQSLQTTEMGLRVMLRSGLAAQALMGALRKEAKSSAFEFVDLADMTKRLLAFGFSAREVIPTIRTLGDVTAAMGGGQAMLDRLIVAVGQIKAKGTLSGEEALQLTEAGIPVREILKVPRGTDIGDMKMPSEEAIAKLMAGLRGRFGGMQAGAVSTLPGIISNIRDAINELSATVTSGLYASLTRAGQALLAFLNNLEQTAAGRTLIAALKSAFDAVGRAVEGLVGKLPGLARWLADVLQGERFERFKQVAINAWEIFKAKAGEAIGWLRENWQAVWAFVVNLARDGIGAVVGLWGGLKAVWREHGDAIVDAFARGLRGVQAFAAGAVEMLGSVVAAAARMFLQVEFWGSKVARHLIPPGPKRERFDRETAQGQAALRQALDWGRRGAPEMARRIRSFDVDQMVGGMRRLEENRGVAGTFARGFGEAQRGFSAWWEGMAEPRPRAEAPAAIPPPLTPTGWQPSAQDLEASKTRIAGRGAVGSAPAAPAGGGDWEERLKELDARVSAVRAWLENQGAWKGVLEAQRLAPLLRQRVAMLRAAKPKDRQGWYGLQREIQEAIGEYNALLSGPAEKDTGARTGSAPGGEVAPAAAPWWETQPMAPGAGIMRHAAELRQMMTRNPGAAQMIRQRRLLPTLRDAATLFQRGVQATGDPRQRAWLQGQLADVQAEMGQPVALPTPAPSIPSGREEPGGLSRIAIAAQRIAPVAQAAGRTVARMRAAVPGGIPALMKPSTPVLASIGGRAFETTLARAYAAGAMPGEYGDRSQAQEVAAARELAALQRAPGARRGTLPGIPGGAPTIPPPSQMPALAGAGPGINIGAITVGPITVSDVRGIGDAIKRVVDERVAELWLRAGGRG